MVRVTWQKSTRLVAIALVVAGIYLMLTRGDQQAARIVLVAGLVFASASLVLDRWGRR